MVADGQRVVALDDLSTGDASRVDPGAVLVEGSVLARALVRRVVTEHEVTGVVHVAAKKQVGESVADPLLYYRENLEGLVSLLEACQAGEDQAKIEAEIARWSTPPA